MFARLNLLPLSRAVSSVQRQGSKKVIVEIGTVMSDRLIARPWRASLERRCFFFSEKNRNQ